MNRYRLLFLCLLLSVATIACGISTPTAAPAPKTIPATVENNQPRQGLTDKQLAEFSHFVEENREAYQIPGVAVAVVQNGQIVFVEGFGLRNLENSAPVAPETLFHIGSTNKSVTAFLIATLVDDGLLSWDTPIIEVYPDFELSDADATEEVTIRHLLSMSSGIPDDAEDDFDLENAMAEDVFNVLANTPLLGKPGEKFSYSNLSSAAAGYVGVIAAGKAYNDDLYASYARLLQERVFNPIGMTTATLSVEEAHSNPNMSNSHEFDDDDEVVTAESYDFTGDPLAPAGSIKASVLDMANYMITQVNRGVAPNGTRVVSEANLTETWQPNIDEGGGAAYAMGWGVELIEDVEVVSHEGSYDGFTSILALVPQENAGLVVLTNLDDPEDFLEVVRDEFVLMIDSAQ